MVLRNSSVHVLPGGTCHTCKRELRLHPTATSLRSFAISSLLFSSFIHGFRTERYQLRLATMEQSKSDQTVADAVAGKSTVGPGDIEISDENKIGNDFRAEDDLEVVDDEQADKSEKKKKKKKKRKNRGGKSTAKRGPTALHKDRGTGFEEYYADPPMTPQEHADEQTEVYSSRIQSCIQRFRARRRLQTEHALFFNEYLFLGGIDTSSNAFGGYDPKDLKDLTPAERRDLMATDTVHGSFNSDDRFYSGANDHWTIDFTGVVAGFFSTPLMALTGGNLQRMEVAADVVANFLRYVLQHDVCPEYEDDVNRALKLCSDAKEEWAGLEALRPSLPGAFNLAAADLFSPPDLGDWTCPVHPRPDDFDPAAVFYTSCCALFGIPNVLEAVEKSDITVIKEHRCTVEVVRIGRASDDIIKKFQRLKIGDGKFQVAPLGTALVRPATIEDGWESPIRPGPVAGGDMKLFFEDATLANMRQGTKMTLIIVELDIGIHFAKACSLVVPTYYTFLPQELMKHYKMPRVNERPAPSVHDLRADAEQHDHDGGQE
ncbi:argonaute complex, subunit Arb1 [Purpureocillium lavendulum]|uniref:Argonaute complex, subunit Arb1 n=1 Tax=Purpureocillium lavendulum TaxID=1247861 RepID=A0AB34G138_9HYPO|nr:argonaute complex, subunit Arb1 [Purpureocillium lavendulum]